VDFLNGQLQDFLGPQEVGAPDDLETVIVHFLDQAEHSLDVAVQELDNPRIAAALDRAARRLRPGTTSRLRVRLVAEGDYLCEEKPVEPPDKTVSLDVNRSLLTLLMRSAVNAKIDFNPKIFHQKFVIRDAERPRAPVLTGSGNSPTPIPTGT
jgi:hypothetical protein